MQVHSFLDRDTETYTHVLADVEQQLCAMIDPVLNFDANTFVINPTTNRIGIGVAGSDITKKLTVAGDITVTGDLTILGDTTTLNSTAVQINTRYGRCMFETLYIKVGFS